MDADVHECTELRHVGDDTIERHARFQIADFAYIIAPLDRSELVARVAAGLAKFFTNIRQRVNADSLGLKTFQLDAVDQFGPGNEILHGYVERDGDLLDDSIRFRMY